MFYASDFTYARGSMPVRKSYREKNWCNGTNPLGFVVFSCSVFVSKLEFKQILETE